VQPETGIELSVSDFVALLNQTLEFAYPDLTIVGELANFRVSKNRWVYFDLKDELSTVKFFGTVYQLPGPLEEGMVLKVRGLPKLHNLYGFSVNIANIQLAGEGTIKRAAELLQAKLMAEGLFDPSRKRLLPYPPQRIGLVTSLQSAAYADFTKILNARWLGVITEVIDVQVQGEIAPAQITAALEQFNEMATPPEVIVLIRGGGSAEDLAAFSTEMVTRAVAASRVPTLVAIGHEVDLSLAELAADVRASTPSNAAELLVPDRQQALVSLRSTLDHLEQAGRHQLQSARVGLTAYKDAFDRFIANSLDYEAQSIQNQQRLLEALNPQAILRRGYAIVRGGDGKSLRSARKLKTGDIVEVQLSDGTFGASVTGKGK
jgi:exodeoxyribonuclease VII large subunit